MQKKAIILAAIIAFIACVAIGVYYHRKPRVIKSYKELRGHIERRGTTLVFYHAAWCPVCPEAKVRFESKVANIRWKNPKVDIVEIDVMLLNRDQLKSLAIETVPRIMSYTDDKEEGQLVDIDALPNMQ